MSIMFLVARARELDVVDFEDLAHVKYILGVEIAKELIYSM